MELIDTKQAIELIRVGLGIEKLQSKRFQIYRDMGFIRIHSGNKGRPSARYLKSEILAGTKKIIEYRSESKYRSKNTTIEIDTSSGCNLFLVLMNKSLMCNH